MKQNKNESIEAYITRRNNVFKAANAAEKRVMIAQDVIDQLKAKNISACSGTFIDFRFDEDAYKKSLQKEVLNKNISCEVCGVGGIFLSTILFTNKVNINENTNGRLDSLGEDILENKETNFTQALKYFSKDQIILIENAFEIGDGYFTYYCSDASKEKFIDKAIDFGAKYETDKDRLIAIMKNIIKNNGKFIP